MTKEHEAQQAQTIPRYAQDNIGGGIMEDDAGYYVTYDAHKAIVDSQAQKIAEQAKEIERLKKERDEARGEAVGYRDSYCAKSPVPPPLPWETTNSKEVTK